MDRREFTGKMAAFLGALGATTSIPSHRSKPTQPARLRVNGERLQRHLSELAEFGRNPYGGVSRLAYSESDRAGRDYVMRLMQRAELDVTIDYGGNIVGRRAGSVSGLPPVMAGSHIDSVPDGGNYDGTVGVLAAIEVAQTLAEAGMVTRHPLEVVVFQNEEGGTVGSRAMIGDLHDRDLDSVARSGKSWRDGIRFLGGVPERLDRPLRQRGDVAAYVELHIEQSGTLEREGIQIGIVEGIVGIGWWDVTVDGFANHAGTTPMNDRRDALLAAARFVEAVNWVAKSEPGRHVATVGRIQAFPGAPNVIPGRVQASLEIRDLDSAKIARLFERVRQEADSIAAATGTTFQFESSYLSKPALMDRAVQSTIERAATELGLTSKYLPSGAGHDAQHMAQIAPAGMIFVPSVGGISHSPKEYTHPADIVNGANVLLQAVIALAG